MKKAISLLLCCTMAVALFLSACGNGGLEEGRPEEDTAAGPAGPSAPEAQRPPGAAQESPVPVPDGTEEAALDGEEDPEVKMTVQVGASTFIAALEDNAAVDALVEILEKGPVTIQMSDYAGFEKVGALGASLPTSNHQTTTQAGDIVLYQGNQIVLFYGSNSWSYTRLGRIDDLTGWTEALGSGDVPVTFSLAA